MLSKKKIFFLNSGRVLFSFLRQNGVLRNLLRDEIFFVMGPLWEWKKEHVPAAKSGGIVSLSLSTTAQWFLCAPPS